MVHGLRNEYLYTAKKLKMIYQKGNQLVPGLGTGFFLKKGNDLVLVTNRHIVEPWFSDEKYQGFELIKLEIESFQKQDGNEIPSNLKSAEVKNFDEFKFSDNYYDDVACLLNPSGDDMGVTMFIPYEYLADEEWINSKLSVCDKIAYPGFPDYYDKINNSPIFRMGTIASDPRLDYSGILNTGNSERIAYEGCSLGGSSGSPVFATQIGYPIFKDLIDKENHFYRESKLVGINAGHYNESIKINQNKETNVCLISSQHSGISYFYKSTIIKRIIDNM